MKSIVHAVKDETGSNGPDPDGRQRRSHGAEFMVVRDSRNRRIPGLALRNDRFYAVLWADRGDGRKATRRFPLLDDDGEPIRTVAAAKIAAEDLRAKLRATPSPATGRKPGFDAWAQTYLDMETTRKKKATTRRSEREALARWTAHLANLRIDRIATPVVKSFIEARLRGCTLGGKRFEPAHPRTVNLDLMALRNALNAAKDTGLLTVLPTFPKVKVPPPPRRPLLTPAEFQRLLAVCTSNKWDGTPLTKNGEQLRDYLQFLAFTGAREKEALGVKWSHIDLAGRRVFIGAPEDFVASGGTVGDGGTSKNRGSRSVDFGPQLDALLREMHARRAPDCSWLFPSPQRGTRDAHAITFRDSLKLVRAAAGLPRLGFHDLRHLFCSFCVMAGIDFMTIAAWLGHKDGGILIGKVYGHLLDEHRQKMAARLSIGLPG